jgi:hypothetical protein
VATTPIDHMAVHRTAEPSVVHLRIPSPIAAFRAVHLHVSMEWSERRDDPLFGLVAVPLAMTATGLLGEWWAWPLLTVEAAVATRAWRWSWIGALETAFVGTEWAWVGATSLASWPSMTLTIGAIWAAFPAALATAVAQHRHQSLRTLFMPQRDGDAIDSEPGGSGQTP